MQEDTHNFLDILKTRCKCGNLGSLICFNQHCSNYSIVCEECDIQSKYHKQCKMEKLSDFLHKINKKRKGLDSQNKKTSILIKNYIQETIEKFSLLRENFNNKIAMFGLKQQTIRFSSYLQQGNQNITGQLTSCAKVQVQSSDIRGFQRQDIINSNINLISKKLNYIFHDFDRLTHLRTYTQITQIQKSIQQAKEWVSAQPYTLNSTVSIEHQHFQNQSFNVAQFFNDGRLFEEIKNFSLIDSNIKSVPQFLTYCTSLKSITLTKGVLEKIENFENCRQLTRLSLIYNHIAKIQNLDNLQKLARLELHGNKIKKIQNLSNLKQLTYLTLSQNQISVLQNLDHLKHLEYLSLYKNPIEQTPKTISLVEQFVRNKTRVFLKGYRDQYIIKNQ